MRRITIAPHPEQVYNLLCIEAFHRGFDGYDPPPIAKRPRNLFDNAWMSSVEIANARGIHSSTQRSESRVHGTTLRVFRERSRVVWILLFPHGDIGGEPRIFLGMRATLAHTSNLLINIGIHICRYETRLVRCRHRYPSRRRPGNPGPGTRGPPWCVPGKLFQNEYPPGGVRYHMDVLNVLNYGVPRKFRTGRVFLLCRIKIWWWN